MIMHHQYMTGGEGEWVIIAFIVLIALVLLKKALS
jgi:hypothetical protein